MNKTMTICLAAHVSFDGPYPIVRLFPSEEDAMAFDDASNEGGDIQEMSILVDADGRMIPPPGLDDDEDDYDGEERVPGVLYKDGNPTDYSFVADEGCSCGSCSDASEKL